ncbi:MAG: c-type cytochrome [Bryobacterales bacterium]|jgi:mono/diheme cytochrome c family protein|nr:c-type cytochrome [Bryobacterales bacterium]
MSSKPKLFGWLSVALCVSAGLWVYWFVTAHGFSAREKPTRLEAVLARHARRIASPPGARDLKNPVNPAPLAIAEARDHFADHCAVCHANDGSGRTQINAGLYPPAPDLRGADTLGLSDGELFYIIKNGIRFTGMPGWGGEDEDNWKLVAFIRHLPNITAKELELMKEVNGLDIHRSESH